MYQYQDFDQRFIEERVEQYREQTERYLNGELSEERFLQLRLRNGLYIQRLAPMLRVAIPYGTLSSRQLRALAEISRRYDKGYGHLSTRQNMQFNWPELASVPDILADLAKVQMHAIQTSGSCIRNVTTDQFAGVADDERVDARPYCEIIRQWSTQHPEFDWLPRKFKIALNGAESDRAAIHVHDIGIRVDRDASGNVVFDFLVGGGLGRTPAIGSVIRRGLPEAHLLTYLEAILRVYNQHGRRDNKYKARIKILVRAMTPEAFAERVDQEWAYLKDSPSTLTAAELDRVKACFAPPEYPDRDDETALLGEQRLREPAFNSWLQNNVARHKVPGYAIATLSTKCTGVPPGDVTDLQMDAVADWADAYGFGEIRIGHEQNFVLPDVAQDRLYELWQRAERIALATPNVGLLTDIVCCPGGDYCSLANAKSIPIAEAIQRRYDDYDYLHDLGPLDLNISGCMNACGHHHVGHIGILGVDKKGAEFYQVSIGGNAGNDASLGRIIGPSFARDDVPEVVERILDVYVDRRIDTEPFLSCFRRIGMQPFKERVYASAG
ncbi:MAG: nitrite/sulfite reductase [Gammaproteobacteria bacterium]|nr:nitrite/sulfite reductase [Gammaproteobacteria bacterium]